MIAINGVDIHTSAIHYLDSAGNVCCPFEVVVYRDHSGRAEYRCVHAQPLPLRYERLDRNG